MEQFKPRNKEEWEIQRKWIEEQMNRGGIMVVDEQTNAVIRFEFENPIYRYYKDQFETREILLASLGFIADELSIMSGDIPDIPPEMKTIRARVYKGIKEKLLNK